MKRKRQPRLNCKEKRERLPGWLAFPMNVVEQGCREGYVRGHSHCQLSTLREAKRSPQPALSHIISWHAYLRLIFISSPFPSCSPINPVRLFSPRPSIFQSRTSTLYIRNTKHPMKSSGIPNNIISKYVRFIEHSVFNVFPFFFNSRSSLIKYEDFRPCEGGRQSHHANYAQCTFHFHLFGFCRARGRRGYV